jgi:hypothetical protein
LRHNGQKSGLESRSPIDATSLEVVKDLLGNVRVASSCPEVSALDEEISHHGMALVLSR